MWGKQAQVQQKATEVRLGGLSDHRDERRAGAQGAERSLALAAQEAGDKCKFFFHRRKVLSVKASYTRVARLGIVKPFEPSAEW
jgi:hypothetical protein